MAKRPCFSDHSPRVQKRDYDRYNIDDLLESLFAFSDFALIDASVAGLVESRSTNADQNDLIQRAIDLGSALLEAGKKFVRKRYSIHNASVWPLSPDLTIKVFSMLDTPSVCSAEATCSFFEKCAKDPLCYANIDLASLVPKVKVPKVNDAMVSTLIQRSGEALKSLKLGVQPPNSTRDHYGNEWGFTRKIEQSRQEKKSFILTSSCLSSLSANGGAPGPGLRRLHLYNIKMDNKALLASLSVCSSLVDLEIVRLNVEINRTLKTVSAHCHLVERFIFEPSTKGGMHNNVDNRVCKEFVRNCPKITTLALKECGLDDSQAFELVKGFHELKYVDFTGSYSFSGVFLNNLCKTDHGGKNLEVMILRDCSALEKEEVERFMEALLEGEFRLLRYLDVSNDHGLAYFDYDYEDAEEDHRHYELSSDLLEELLEQRPSLRLVAEFPDPSYIEVEQKMASDLNTLPSQLSSSTSDGYAVVV